MHTNKFKAALSRKEQQIGLWLSLADPYTAEICATAGFDWLLIDGEHAPNDVRSILAQLQAVAPYRAHPVVRPVGAEVSLIKQLLDVGAQTLLVPMIDTAEQARRVVSAMRYPPNGVRGVGSAVARVSRWGEINDYLERADAETCLLVQVETKQALTNLDEICSVEGVDGVFIGPADLAASLGHRGNPMHADVQSAIENAMTRIVASGKAAGTLVLDPALAQRYLSLGCTFLAAGVDAILLAHATRDLASAFLDEETRQSALGQTSLSCGDVFPVIAEYTLLLEDIGSPTEGEKEQMWNELYQQADAKARKICASLPGCLVPQRESADPAQANEIRGSGWHMKVKFNMKCSS
jgi:4-hydroxy-2-oxoheptanedioate aldolase